MAAVIHVKVLTTDVVKSEDMVRYIGYAGVPETANYNPALGKHRFQEGKYTVFRCPKGLRPGGWAECAIDRWRSFGVRAMMVRL